MSFESQDFYLEKLQAIRNDPWEFLKIVRTLDPADKKNPIKPFPVHLTYLKYYVRAWQKDPKILVPKSRRMKMSWVNLALYTWDTAFHVGRHNAFVSKKEDDSNDLVEKAKFILENLDFTQLPKELIPKFEKTFNLLVFPETHSRIEGYPSGADQLRSYTFSGIMADEMAFWEDAEKMYSASVPTLEGGGRFTGISSAAPGFFQKLVFDNLDENLVSTEETKHLYPMEGLHLWRNPKNGFLVFEIHYKADPAKRDPEYIRTIRESMPVRQFRQEYEIQWESFEGLSVFADWDISIHGVNKSITPHIGMPLLLGVDFGLTPALIVCQVQEENLFAIKEFTAMNMGAQRFFSWVVPQLKTLFPLWLDFAKDYIVFIDPSGMYRKDTDESNCAQIIESFGFRNIVPGPERWEERKESVESFLTKRTRHGSSLQVSLPNCPLLVRGFQGGYRYDDNVLVNEPNKLRPKKDIHSHIHDALQMVTSRIVGVKRASNVTIPRLNYSWSK